MQQNKSQQIPKNWNHIEYDWNHTEMFSDHTADKLNVNILKDNLKIPKYLGGGTNLSLEKEAREP